MSRPLNDVEELLASRLHDICLKEMRLHGRVWRVDAAYEDLTESAKELDRALARWILLHWTPKFSSEELPEA